MPLNNQELLNDLLNSPLFGKNREFSKIVKEAAKSNPVQWANFKPQFEAILDAVKINPARSLSPHIADSIIYIYNLIGKLDPSKAKSYLPGRGSGSSTSNINQKRLYMDGVCVVMAKLLGDHELNAILTPVSDELKFYSDNSLIVATEALFSNQKLPFPSVPAVKDAILKIWAEAQKVAQKKNPGLFPASGAPATPVPASGAPTSAPSPASPAGPGYEFILKAILDGESQGRAEVKVFSGLIKIDEGKVDKLCKDALEKFGTDYFNKYGGIDRAHAGRMSEFAKNAYMAMYLVKGKAEGDEAAKKLREFVNIMTEIMPKWMDDFAVFSDVRGVATGKWGKSMSGTQAADIFNILKNEVIKRISGAIESKEAETHDNMAGWKKLLNIEFLANPQAVGSIFGSKSGINQGIIMQAQGVVDGVSTAPSPERAVILILQRCEGIIGLEQSLVQTGKWPEGVEPYNKIKSPGQMDGKEDANVENPEQKKEEKQINTGPWLNTQVICMASAILYILYGIYYSEQAGGNKYR